MNETKLSRWSARYLTALGAHFKQGPQTGLRSALSLGHQAVALGLETLDMARIHDLALGTLVLPGCTAALRQDMNRQGVEFFTEAITPIEETHRVALDLAKTNRELLKEILRSQAAEKDLQSSEKESARLLEESRQLHDYLQNLAHLLLAAQEDERRTMSLTLQDEVAQILLGINIRLLALKKEVTLGTTGFEKELATTQRLVEKSVRTINHFVREFGPSHEN